MIRKRVVAAVLVIVLCMTFAPRSVLQAAADGIKEIDFTTDANVAKIKVDDISIGEKPSDNIVMEYVEDRTETEKKFLMDDGSIMVRQYAAPIHIKDENGQFQETDAFINTENALYSVENTEIEKDTEANGLTLYDNNTVVPEYNANKIKIGKIKSNIASGFISFPNRNDQYKNSGYYLAYGTLKYRIRSVGNNTAGTTKYRVRTARNYVPLNQISSVSDVYFSGNALLTASSVQSTKKWYQSSATHQSKSETVYFAPEFFNGYADMTFVWEATSTNGNQHAEIDVRSGEAPVLSLYYLPTAGINENQPYEKFSYNGGTGNVNLIDGSLNATFDVLSINTASNPLTLQLVYNDDYNGVMEEFGMKKMFGNNIKVNFQQAITTSGNITRYIDEDGSVNSLIKTDGSRYYSYDKNIVYNSVDKVIYRDGNVVLESNEGKVITTYLKTSDSDERPVYTITYQNGIMEDVSCLYSSDTVADIQFHYKGTMVDYVVGRIKKRSGSSYTQISRVDFTYDTNGNLVKVTNNETGNDKFRIVYDTNEENKLTKIYDDAGNVYTSNLTHWSSPSVLKRNCAWHSFGNYGGETQSIGGTSFTADEAVTKVEYKENDAIVKTRNVARKSGAITSEWVTDNSNGKTHITTKLVSASTLDSSSKTNVYTYTYALDRKNNVSIEKNSAEPGGEADVRIGTNHGIVNVEGQSYCVGLLLECAGNARAEIKVNGAVMERVSFNGANKTYVTVSLPYVTTATLVSVNNTGVNTIKILDATYNTHVGQSTVRSVYKGEDKNYISSVTTRKKGVIYETQYNNWGRTTRVFETDYKSGKAVQESYTYAYNGEKLTGITGEGKSVLYSYPSAAKKVITVKNGSDVILKSTVETTDNISNYTIKRTDNGIVTKTYYDLLAGDVRLKKIESDGTITEYGYDSDGHVVSITQNGITQNIDYTDLRTNGYRLGNAYSLTRDNSSLITKISRNNGNDEDVDLLSIDYYGGKVQKKEYANGDTLSYAYNYGYGMRASATWNDAYGETLIDYGYTDWKLTDVTQSVNGIVKLAYNYSDSDTVKRLTVDGDVNAAYEYVYDDFGLLQSFAMSRDNGSSSVMASYWYNDNNTLSIIDQTGYATFYYYDAIDRISEKRIQIGGKVVGNPSYTYLSGTDYTTGKIATITDKVTDKQQKYEYSGNRISKYYDEVSGSTRQYSYDAAGRLLSDGLRTYAYDAYNNLTRKSGTGGTTTFKYGAKDKTRLTSVLNGSDEKYFSYDASGNITTYKGETKNSPQNLYWSRGNKLKSGRIGLYFEYEYDANNIRYKKTVNNDETVYYYNGTTLISERTGNDYIRYLYDESGICGMTFNGMPYYFEKNIMGDVMRVYDQKGVKVAEFTYDSYGNICSETGDMAYYVKIRYRGYYYDNETGFYYLQSRYYDPSIGRFISADQPELIPSLAMNIGQLNLYAYCNNDPISYTDESGEGIIAIIAVLVVCAVIGGTIGGVVSYNKGNTGWDLTKDIILGTAIGLAAGGAIVSSWGVFVGAHVALTGKIATVLGVSAKQAFGIGALAYNFTAMFIAPLYGIKMQEIEYSEPTQQTVPTDVKILTT